MGRKGREKKEREEKEGDWTGRERRAGDGKTNLQFTPLICNPGSVPGCTM